MEGIYLKIAAYEQMREQIKSLSEQLQQLSAALSTKDEALKIVGQALAWRCFGECRSYGESVKLLPANEADAKAKEALALQPHASLVAKIKADAVRGFAVAMERAKAELPLPFAHDYANRIERGEVK